MNIRRANVVDIERCARLSGDYRTQHVWQMDENRSADAVGVRFRRVRIPREIGVNYPRSMDALQDDWQRKECFLVADELGHLLGFVDMTVSHWQWQANIEHLIVDQTYRRRGVAGRLLAVAERWALGSELTAITAAVQGKNDPAISLLTQRGYAFRGYVDKYFTNGDAAVLYSLSL